MTVPTATRSVLGTAGLAAVAVGGGLLLDPVGFNALADVPIGTDSSVLSDARGSGGAILATGGLMVAGALDARLTRTAALVGTLMYLGYGVARLLSAAVDGMPTTGIATAGVLELALGTACTLVLVRTSERRSSQRLSSPATA